MKKGLLITSAIVLLLVFLTKYAVSGDQKAGGVSQEQIMQKIHRIQIPFIANNGQMDEKVTFYANTFGGTVFVTKDGEIVYALPKSANDDNRSQEPGARIQKCRGELHSPDVIHDGGCGIHENRESYIKSCSLGEACPEPVEWAERTQHTGDPHPPTPKSQPPSPNMSLQGVALKETLIGAKVKDIKGEDKSVTKVNYFKGSDPSKWETNIATYDVVNLGEVYKGIELKLKAYGNNVEKLFYVKPGVDPDQIRISLSGIQPPGNPPPLSPSVRGTGVCPPLAGVGGGLEAGGLWINEQGQLVAETGLGPVAFTKPVAYQEIDGKRVYVDVEYQIENCKMQNAEQGITHPLPLSRGEYKSPLLGGNSGVGNSERQNPKFVGSPETRTNNPSTKHTGSGFVHATQPETKNSSTPNSATPQPTYGFKVASYDRTKDLIIDPLLASTYLSGSSYDNGYSLALDTSGNVYVTGSTPSSDFPTTSGAYDTSYNGSGDVFVSKLDSGLTSLLASTYLGGSSSDEGYSLALDTSGNVYVTGGTLSSDFPTTSGAYDTSFNASGYGNIDAFVSKLNSGLTSLLASTYLGGSGGGEGISLALDTSGNVYVMGETWSSDFPTTSGAYDTSYNGPGDVFVSKLDSGLTSLLASTFLGGFNTDYGYSLALDTSGNVYVTGVTGSSDFPTTSGAYDTSFNGYYDVFVSKLDTGLTSLLASTYLGGSSSDEGYSIALDTSGNAYVTGSTWSSDFPTTSGAYDTSYNDGHDVFVSKLDSGLTSLLASTYLGGAGGDSRNSLALDTSGNVYVTGYTLSTDFPTTSGAYDTSYHDNGDVFVSKLDGGLTSLLASTYLGGSGYDWGESLSLDTSGNVYVTGYTQSTDFPTTSGAYDTSFNDGDGYDVFVSKLDSDLSASECPDPDDVKATTASVDQVSLILAKGSSYDVTITVTDDDDCPAKGVKVKRRVSSANNKKIEVSPDSEITDASGQATFTIKARKNKGKANVKFNVSGVKDKPKVKVTLTK